MKKGSRRVDRRGHGKRWVMISAAALPFAGASMFTQQRAIRGIKLILIASVLWVGVLSPGPGLAGGLIAYEFGTADDGLASAGFDMPRIIF